MKILLFGSGSDMALPISQTLKEHQILCLTHKQCDVTNVSAVSRVLSMYTPQIVINLAGVSHLQKIKDSILPRWQSEIATNLIGPYYIAREAIDNGVQKMIFIGSVAGFHGKDGHSGYSASKAGVHSLVQSLAAEGHKAYAIAPGRVNTKMREKDFPGEDIRTRLTTQQIAEVVKDIIDDKYEPGDVAIIRKIGFTTHKKTYKGQPWRKWLKVAPWEKWSGF